MIGTRIIYADLPRSHGKTNQKLAHDNLREFVERRQEENRKKSGSITSTKLLSNLPPPTVHQRMSKLMAGGGATVRGPVR